jgi:hypothetical protein
LHGPTEPGGQGVSYIVYNGITLSLIQTKKVIEEPITVGQQTSGMRRTVTVLATVHNNTAGPVALGAPVPGQVAPAFPDGVAAWIGIRNQLMQQRRTFTYAVGNRIVASYTAPFGATNLSPGPNRVARFSGDQELGPKPLACNLVQFNGTATCVMEYTIQWSDKNCLDSPNQAVLAHVWKCDDDISETYFLTRTYQGRVIFDPRVVGGPSGALGIHPDRVRGLLLPAKANGFIRKQVLIQSSEDMKTLDYLVIDEQPQSFVNSNLVPKITATHAITNRLPTFGERAGAVASQLGAIQPPVHDPKRDIQPARSRVAGFANRGFEIAGVLGGIANFVAHGYSAIPLATHTIEVTAYGAPYCPASELARSARIVALWRLMKGTQVADPGLGVPDYGGSCIQQDSSEPFATTVRLEVVSRPLTMAPDNIAALWNLGRNQMVRFVGVGVPIRVDEPITSALGGRAVPASIQQLMYGGSFQGHPGDWGWVQTGGFAQDLMSNKDFNFRGVVNNGVLGTLGPNGEVTPFALMLIQTLQEVCDDTTAAAVFVDTAPLTRWPGANQ